MWFGVFSAVHFFGKIDGSHLTSIELRKFSNNLAYIVTNIVTHKSNKINGR